MREQTDSRIPGADAAEGLFDVIVIGGGQAGLSMGYHLLRRQCRFVILDADERIGDVWRRRWDSLRLFTPAALDGLDGLPFPAPPRSFPTKDQMADYLEAYATHYALPVRKGMRVERLRHDGTSYVVSARGETFRARHVVVATGAYRAPRVPPFSRELAPSITQLHASAYENPGQLRPGAVLVVGAGNSGAEIALELSRTHQVFLSGSDVGEIPFDTTSQSAFWFLTRLLLRVLFHRIFTIKTPIGRRVRLRSAARAVPLIRTKRRHLRAAGVESVARTSDVRGGLPLLADGRTLEVTNVVWCSGYASEYGWLERPIFDTSGEPNHDGGVVPGEPGLYFVGLHFLYAMSSSMIHGVGRDAERLAGVIAGRIANDARALPIPPSSQALTACT